MRIVQLSLTDFIPVKDSGINHLEVSFTEDVQLIIGSNGSGKSQTTRQLTPYPAIRSMFGKKGKKILVLEKDGTYYRLESDYNKSASPHFLYIDDSEENINVGGTTDVQKELIQEHLGITPFIDDLIMNRFVFPRWTATKRKEFLMAHNPDDIGFVLQLAKQTSSKIRACKNNLARLQSRKILLEQDLLTEEVLQELELEKNKIQDDLSHFQQNLMDIEVGLRTLGDLSYSTIYDYESIKRTLRNIRYSMSKLKEVDRDDHQRSITRDKLVGELASCVNRIKLVDETILSQSQELNELEVQYKELAPDGDLREIEETISRLEEERDRLHIQKPQFEISREELNRLYIDWEEIREQLLTFQDCTVPLYSRKKRQHRERQLELSRYKQSSYQMKLSDLRTQYEDLSKRHTMSPQDIPDAPCAKNACPLYSHFMEGYENAESKRNELSIQINRLRRRLDRGGKFIGWLTDYFDRSSPYHDRIEGIVGAAQRNPILHSVLREIDILSTLRTSPNTIALRLKSEYDHIDQWLKLKSILSDLEIANSLKSRLMGSQNHDTVKLVVSIENLKKSLYALRNEVLALSDKRKAIQRKLDDIQTYEGIKHTVLSIKKTHAEYIKIMGDKHESDRLLFLKKGVEEVRTQMFLRLSDVEKTLRSQSGLQERYQEEVVKEINRIEKELADLSQMEKALFEIPKKNTVDFVNGIFDQANRLIEMVWTIPFQIELLKPDDNLTYEFMVSGDNQSLREMNECSDGQTEILSLAINLALRIQLGHLNIPLCLDETGRTFDSKHKSNLALLLKRLLDDKIVSQLFLVSHDALIHEAFSSSETLVLREDNIMLPQEFNFHASIN